MIWQSNIIVAFNSKLNLKSRTQREMSNSLRVSLEAKVFNLMREVEGEAVAGVGS